MVAVLPPPPDALPAGETVEDFHSLELQPIPRAAAAARRFVRESVPELDESTEESVVLLTSELVTNVIIHARTTLVVGVAVTPSYVLITVHDLDLGRSERDPMQREGGRGLILVETVADAAGMYQHPEGGKTAWFRMTRAAGDPS